MVFQALSQVIYKVEPRVNSFVNTNGDTLIEMTLADARVVLIDLLEKQTADSIINVYEKRDSLSISTIMLQKKEMLLLQQKAINNGMVVTDLNDIISNKNKEIVLLNDVIKQQKKQLFKQRVLKVIGFSAAVILPILVIMLHL